ncbi:MAG TPA: alpha/beta hydrolase [Solirubrobacteraceae bacterium]
MIDAPARMTLRERTESAAVRALLALPASAQRRLAGGAPIRRDGQVLDHEMQLLLRLMEAQPGPALPDLTPPQARAEILRTARSVAGPPVAMARVEELTVAGAAGPLPARLYVPLERASAEPGPLLVFFHGGGWVVGDRDSHDAPCRTIAERAGVRVLSVDYRLAPEHPFPAPLDDAVAAFRDVAARAGTFGADAQRIAVGGDSAGGHLATLTALACARGGGSAPAFQLLIYPVTDLSAKSASYGLFGEGFFLTEADMDWYAGHFVPPGVERTDPRVSPLLAADLGDLAPAYVVTAGFDPLRDEGEAYAARLREAGVPVTLRRQRGLVHGFVNMVGAGRAASAAVSELSAVLRAALQR